MPLTENFEVLATNVEFPYIDVYQWPAYGFAYAHQIYYKPSMCIVHASTDSIMAAFVASAMGQLDILIFNLTNFDLIAQRRLELLTNERMNSMDSNIMNMNKEELTQYCVHAVLRDIVKHHNIIMRYVSLIEGAFSLASALQLMLSAMVLCLVGVHILSIEDPMSHPILIAWMMIYLACMFVEVFIICWFGDALIWKSLEVHQAAFDAPWPSIDSKTAMFIIIIKERCKRPLLITAGKVFTLSLDTYTILIKWAYKAFAVMRQVKQLNIKNPSQN